MLTRGCSNINNYLSCYGNRAMKNRQRRDQNYKQGQRQELKSNDTMEQMQTPSNKIQNQSLQSKRCHDKVAQKLE